MNASDVRILLWSIASVGVLSYGHFLDSTPIIVAGLLLIVINIVAHYKKSFIDTMLFYLPFAPVLKIEPNSFSFYTIAFLIVFALFSVNIKFRYDIRAVLVGVGLIVASLLAKIVLGHQVSLDYFVFITMLVFIPTYLKQYGNYVSFEKVTKYFTFGIIAACIASSQLMSLPSMHPYINVYEWEKMDLTRLSGFYGDANYYSAQILAAISSLLVLVTYKAKESKLIVLSLVAILIYFGSLSVSKSFLIILALILAIWFLAFMLSNRRFKEKISIVFAVGLMVGVIGASGVLSGQASMYQTRFDMTGDASSLTTGRSDIFANYYNYFNNNRSTLLYGQGYTQVTYEELDDRASHNTLIQIIFQFGFMGSVLLACWIHRLIKISSEGIKRHKKRLADFFSIWLIGVGCFLPWLALDILFFDDFFYIILIFILAKKYIRLNMTRKVEAV